MAGFIDDSEAVSRQKKNSGDDTIMLEARRKKKSSKRDGHKKGKHCQIKRVDDSSSEEEESVRLLTQATTSAENQRHVLSSSSSFSSEPEVTKIREAKAAGFSPVFSQTPSLRTRCEQNIPTKEEAVTEEARFTLDLGDDFDDLNEPASVTELKPAPSTSKPCASLSSGLVDDSLIKGASDGVSIRPLDETVDVSSHAQSREERLKLSRLKQEAFRSKHNLKLRQKEIPSNSCSSKPKEPMQMTSPQHSFSSASRMVRLAVSHLCVRENPVYVFILFLCHLFPVFFFFFFSFSF